MVFHGYQHQDFAMFTWLIKLSFFWMFLKGHRTSAVFRSGGDDSHEYSCSLHLVFDCCTMSYLDGFREKYCWQLLLINVDSKFMELQKYKRKTSRESHERGFPLYFESVHCGHFHFGSRISDCKTGNWMHIWSLVLGITWGVESCYCAVVCWLSAQWKPTHSLNSNALMLFPVRFFSVCGWP